MKLLTKTSKLFLTIILGLYSLAAFAQPAGSPVYYEGEIYNTIIIGSQCWMTENLDVGKIISGTTMPSNDGFIEKTCYNDNPLNCNTYGGLYRWNELMQYTTVQGSQGICPTGWHIPKDFEWTQLVNGFTSDADVHLVVGGSSGFDATFGGYANTTGGFYQLGLVGAYFSSTKVSFQAYRRSFDGMGLVSRALAGLSDGYSVRCMRNSLTDVIPFDISITGYDAKCNGSASGYINLLVSGASNPSFVWSNGSTVEDLVDVVAGTYTVTVTEGTQTLIESVTISEPAVLTATASINTGITCYNGTNGILSVAVSGGTGPYTYLWSNGQTSAQATGFNAGNHSVTVTDANDCEAFANVSISNPTQFVFFTAIASNLSCYNDNSGSIDITPQGTGSFLYNWSNYQVSQDQFNLPADNYTVTVTHNGHCSVGNYELTEPPLLNLSTQGTNPTDQTSNDGSIELTVTGGTLPYVYSWSNGATTEDLFNLPGGNYFVTVTDANQCSDISNEIVLVEPGVDIANIVISDISCNGLTNGSIYVDVNGSGYTFDIGFSSNGYGYFGGLSAGTYTITVSDNIGGVEVLNNLVIAEPAPILFTVNQSAGCSGTNLTVTVNGGTPPFMYSKNGTTYQTSNIFENVIPGNYTIYVKDAENCENSQYVLVSSFNGLSVNETITNPLCSGATNGSIQLSVLNGVSPITYSWSNGSTSSYNTGLSAGNYWVTVSSGNGCSVVEAYTLTNPPSISVNLVGTDVSSQGGSDGSINAYISGGTSPYSFNWSNGLSLQNISGLIAGQYILTLTDANQCNAYGSAIINVSASPLVISVTNTDITCYGGNDGSVSVIASGGNPPYSYYWSNGLTSSTLTGLSFGTFQVTVTDNTNDTQTGSTNLTNPSPLYISFQTNTDYNGYDVSCFTCSDGQLTAYGALGVYPYSYQWSNGVTTNVNTGLSAGTYFLTLTDGNGCVNTGFKTLDAPAELSTAINISHVSCFNGTDGEIITYTTGGVPPYTRLWSTGAITGGISNQAAGTYMLTVTDANGATESISAVINEPSVIAVTATINDVVSGNDGSILLVVSGGTPPYLFNWSGTSQNANNIYNLTAGTYTITVTDDNGCTFVESYTIGTTFVPLGVSIIDNDVLCYDDNNGSAAADAFGGTSPYTYQWSTGETVSELFELAPGEYFLTVYDANLDSVMSSALIGEPLELDLSIVTDDVTCFGGNDGQAEVIVSGGTPLYSYLWSNGISANISTNLIKGNHTVYVSDMNDCFEIMSFEIAQPFEYSINSNITNTNGIGNSDGSAIIAVSGNTAPYSYNWSNGETSFQNTNLASGAYSVQILDANLCEIWHFIEVGTDIFGCMDPLALNYNPDANIDDGLCTYNQNFTQVIPLDSAWSLISTYIIPTSPDIAAVLSSVNSEVIIVKNGNGDTYWPLYGVNMIGNMVIGEGYQINMVDNNSVTVSGTAVLPELVMISVPESWSILGYLRNTPAPIITMLSPIASNIEIVKNDFGGVYWPIYSVDQIGNMFPGKGYQINMNTSDIFTYPANSNLYPELSNKNECNSIDIGLNTGSNMTFGIPLSSWENTPEIGSRIVARNNRGDVVGLDSFDGNNTVLTVWGDDELTVKTDGMMDNDQVRFFIINDEGIESELVINSWLEGDDKYKTNGISVAADISINIEEASFTLHQNIPNPFRNYTDIVFSTSQSSVVYIRVYNLTGELVADLGSYNSEPGNNTVRFDGGLLPAGTYMYKVISGTNEYTQLMNLVK